MLVGCVIISSEVEYNQITSKRINIQKVPVLNEPPVHSNYFYSTEVEEKEEVETDHVATTTTTAFHGSVFHE